MATWLQKRMLAKKKAKEKQENILENLPLPVLGVGVLTGLGERTLTPTWAWYWVSGTHANP